MKLGVLVIFWVALDHVLLPVASWLLDWMRPWSQVVFVEALFPLTMNVIQVSCDAGGGPRSMLIVFSSKFWIIDTIIRSSGDLYVVQAKDFEELPPPSQQHSPVAPLLSALDRRRWRNNNNKDTSDGYGSTSESGSPAMVPQDHHDEDDLDLMEQHQRTKFGDDDDDDDIADLPGERPARISQSRISDADRRSARRSLSSDFGRPTKGTNGDEQELATRPR